MKRIFVNLKRFDIPRRMGGVCPSANARDWIEWVVDRSIANGLGGLAGLEITFLLPEGFILAAVERLARYPADRARGISLGCQGVFHQDVAPGGNFGAFTTHLPASAAKNLGCTWAIIGHSEERRSKLGIIERFDPALAAGEERWGRAQKAVNELINAEVLCALRAELDVLLCVGETAEERGDGTFAAQKPRLEKALRSQLTIGLDGVAPFLHGRNLILAYEPIWAIGPGKIPPSSDYIAYVSAFIKQEAGEGLGLDPMVVYGGGLKEENAGPIATIGTIDGGLVALTRFTGEIGFEPDGLKVIVDRYLGVG